MSSGQALSHPGPLGVWCWPDGMDARGCVDFAKQLESWGYSAWWIPEAVGRDPFALIGFLAGQTDELIFATGIANVYARDAVTMKATWMTLSEVLPRRFILGLGVSHPHLVSHLRGHEWEKPIPKMRSYLDAMDEAIYHAPEPDAVAPVVLAALRPLMLGLAGERARGAHPYLVTPEHTRRAREILGEGPWLCPEQMLIHESDTQKARELARTHLSVYLRAPNYQNSLLELGFEEADFGDGGSDRLVDALVAWGDEEALRDRIDAHHEAGADHVCIQAFRPDGARGPDLEALRMLAPS